MDNSSTSRLIRYQGRNVEPADVIRMTRTDAVIPTVQLLVGCAASDLNTSFSAGFQQAAQRIAYAATVLENQPTGRTGRLCGREPFGAPLQLIKPVVRIIDGQALRIFAQAFKAQSLNLDRHPSGLVEELYVPRCSTRLPLPHASVTPLTIAGTTV